MSSINCFGLQINIFEEIGKMKAPYVILYTGNTYHSDVISEDVL